MNPTLKAWAKQGMSVDLCLALQTQASFAHLHAAVGLSKAKLQARLPRPLVTYKGPMNDFIRAVDKFAQEHHVELWRVWGMVSELRDMVPALGEAGVNDVATRWEVKPEILADAFFHAMTALEISIRVEERKGEFYIHFVAPPPAGTLTMGYGRASPASLVPILLEMINTVSRPVDARNLRLL